MSMENGHFYRKDGTPCHTQPTKAGAKNATRPTNISDAKKLGLLPSVSGITKMLSSPALEKHKMKEVAKQCFLSPAHPGEDMDAYISAMVEKASEDAGNAADLGTKIHAAIEGLLTQGGYTDEDVTLKDGTVVPLSTLVQPAVTAWNETGLEPIGAEMVLVNLQEGYAGTTDLIFQAPTHLGVWDWKSRRTKPGKSVDPIETHPMQISAYVAAHWGAIPTNAVGYNCYISTTEPGRVDVVRYDYDTLKAAWADFRSLCHLWRSRNGYDPRTT